MLAGFSICGFAWQRSPTSAREVQLPISALLARIRKLIPRQNDCHYDEIVRGFGVGALRTPASPMSDGELARAIADFLRDDPSAETVSSLGRRFHPSSSI
jgi:hypothetical protein